ncbi:MAG: hypothetical protein J5869_06720 [Bacteroidaceae bacterium]|nr:hypothetical protein [Bacteroidaceae bacterium]
MTGGILILAGAAVHITGWEYASVLFAIGTILFVTGQFSDRYEGDDMVIKRLRGQQLTGSVFLVLTAVLMFSGPFHESILLNQEINPKLRTFLIELTRRNNWIVTLTIAALFELYPAFRIERRYKELEKTGNDMKE